MTTKVLENEDAVNFFLNDSRYNYMTDSYLYFDEWKHGKNIKAYLLYDGDSLKSFALISKLVYDPEQKHINPYYFNYIYTFEDERRKGYAYNLVTDVKDREELTVFCIDDITTNLFQKAGYTMNGYEKLYNAFPIFRSP